MTILQASSVVENTPVGRVVSVDSTNRYVYYLPAVDSVGNFNDFANSNGVRRKFFKVLSSMQVVL